MPFIYHMAYTFALKLAKNGNIPVEGGVFLFLLSILVFTGLPRVKALAIIFSSSAKPQIQSFPLAKPVIFGPIEGAIIFYASLK